MACKPKKINTLKKSIYSLDNIDTLPINLKYYINNNKMTYINKSPLRYPGGKTRACKILDDIISRMFNNCDIKTIISPFLGGGSVEFYMQNKYNCDIICNDKFTPLYIFWDTCRHPVDKQNMIDELYKLCGKVDLDFFNKCRHELLQNDIDKTKIATNYFTINRCSFSGATMSGGYSSQANTGRFTKTSVDRIYNLNLDKFEIYNEDFSTFIPRYKDMKNTIFFIDPPYLLEKKNNKLYGNNGDMHETFDHIKLCNILKKLNCDWILTYNNSDNIRTLYKNFKIIDAEWAYGMNKSKKSSEIIIINVKVNQDCIRNDTINYKKLTVVQLKQKCKEHNIKRYSKLKKNDIINLLHDNDNCL